MGALHYHPVLRPVLLGNPDRAPADEEIQPGRRAVQRVDAGDLVRSTPIRGALPHRDHLRILLFAVRRPGRSTTAEMPPEPRLPSAVLP